MDTPIIALGTNDLEDCSASTAVSNHPLFLIFSIGFLFFISLALLANLLVAVALRRAQTIHKISSMTCGLLIAPFLFFSAIMIVGTATLAVERYLTTKQIIKSGGNETGDKTPIFKTPVVIAIVVSIMTYALCLLSAHQIESDVYCWVEPAVNVKWFVMVLASTTVLPSCISPVFYWRAYKLSKEHMQLFGKPGVAQNLNLRTSLKRNAQLTKSLLQLSAVQLGIWITYVGILTTYNNILAETQTDKLVFSTFYNWMIWTATVLIQPVVIICTLPQLKSKFRQFCKPKVTPTVVAPYVNEQALYFDNLANSWNAAYIMELQRVNS